MIGLSQIQNYMKKQAEEDKNRQFVNVSGATLEEALQQASIELSLPVKRIEYEVLEKGSHGVLGVGKRPYLILAYPLSRRQQAEDSDNILDMDFGFDGEATNENADGGVFVRLTPEGVLLKVTRPTGSGARATERMAMETLSSRSDARLDTGRISRVVKQAEGVFVKVGDFEYDPSADAALSVEISSDEMKAYITALPPGPGGTDPDYDTLVTMLQNNGVIEGFREEVLRRLEETPIYREPILVAEGKKPVNGQDARIVMNFDTESKVHLKETDGKVDFKELNIVQNVVEGQVLAKKIPPERGEPGRTVTGRLLPAKDGLDASIQVGKNVRLSEDKRTAFAEINGQVTMLGGKLNVEPVYSVNGDVNLKTGNILFLGTVIVKGNVDDGFNIKAAGNIEVMGSVGKCDLDAEGDVIVHQGITGKTSGVVRCGKNLWSKFIENARAEAGELVVVSDGIINSEVFSNKKVICRGKRASIVGGRIRASEEINAKSLGSVAGMETILEVGYDPKTKERLGQLDTRKAEINKQLEEIDLNMSTLKNLVKQKQKLSEDRKQFFAELQGKRGELVQELKKVKDETEELNNYLTELKTSGKISASGAVFPGVKVHIKDAALDVRNEFKAVTFISEGNTVKVTKYEESEEDITISRKG